tara:strand:- start:893 stop:1039 length:147 start_codon:yes stop_codon:yes gene_type:complete
LSAFDDDELVLNADDSVITWLLALEKPQLKPLRLTWLKYDFHVRVFSH